MRTYITLIFGLLFAIIAQAAPASASWVLRGIVRDSVTLEPIGWASVLAEGSSTGVLSRDDGTFTIRIPKGCSSLSVTSLGYDKKVIPLKQNSINLVSVISSHRTTP